MAGTTLFVITMLLGTLCFASSEPARPACTAHLRGKIWPEKTSRGAGVPIEICAPKGWKYRWQQLTVDVSQLKAVATRKAVIAGLATPEPVRTPE